STVCLAGSRVVVVQQQVAMAVDKSIAAVAEHVEPEQERTVEGAASGSVGVGMAKAVLHSVAKQQFVAENLFFGSQDRLAGHETDSGRGRGCRLAAEGRLRRRRSHSLIIGPAGQVFRTPR